MTNGRLAMAPPQPEIIGSGAQRSSGCRATTGAD
jgi:hypothetical protein